MSGKKKKLFISTAIDYVNALPHCGHALEKIQADVIARYHRILGEDVFFLTGTDENSLKNVQAAEREGTPVKEFVDRIAKKFYELKKLLNLSFDDFIRTTEKRHFEGAQKLWKVCQKDIYKKKYRGLYCVGCEEFYKESELVDGCCPEHGEKLEVVEEENYFFRLSKYQEQIKKIIETDKVKIIPEVRKNEILSFINSGLQDICISRSNERARGWGIDVPGDPSQKMWCWIEALANYITALGYAKNSKKFKGFWQENKNKLHVIGKGISRFHAVYWLGILLSVKLTLPETIFVHGYLTSKGQKMSKSLGNVVDPFDLVEKYGTDPVRYFLLREISPTEDGDFTIEKFEERYNADLASGIGNLLARVITLANKFKVPARQSLRLRPMAGGQSSKFKIIIQNSKLKEIIKKTKKQLQKAMDNFKFNEALAVVWGLVSFCDGYIEREKPWEEGPKQKEVIQNLLVVLTEIAQMLKPFLPGTSEKILAQLKTKKAKALFPRVGS